MKNPAIIASNIGKEYLIGAEKSTSIRDSLASIFKPKKKKNNSFWALSNVSFTIEQGDVVAIIGRNGAGKSTLLKILSQITKPTTGTIDIFGRVASLLEVGTGFHPELTGRENIYLNGTILGMSRKEVSERFDEIVAFSEIEEFLDTPVKRYSSGMYVRLAFAVAAHLQPEILIVDEVLAVGDSEFQKKCLGKMQDVSNSGRTVLFVSHNIAAVKTLCTKGIVIKKGQIVFQGGIQEAVSFYQNSMTIENPLVKTYSNEAEFKNENIELQEISMEPQNGEQASVSSGMSFKIHFKNKLEKINLDCTIELRSVDETVVFHTGALVSQDNDSKIGAYVVAFDLPSFYLNAGRYSLSLIFGKNQREQLFATNYCYYFDVENDVALGNNSSILPGVMRPNFDFKVSYHS